VVLPPVPLIKDFSRPGGVNSVPELAVFDGAGMEIIDPAVEEVTGRTATRTAKAVIRRNEDTRLTFNDRY
jgi:hypothetical protein